MNYILGRHKVDDITAWKAMMESHRPAHLKMGLHFEEVWSNVDDPKEIYFLFEIDDLEQARAGLQAAGALDADKQKRGEIPVLTFLEAK
jgi:hypothetical protein